MANNGLHLLSQKPPTPRNQRPYVGCRQCSAEGRGRITTRNICAICPGNPGLCSRQCFINYHEAQDLVPAFVQKEPVPNVQATIHQPVEVPDLRSQLISVPASKKKLYPQKRCRNCSKTGVRKSCRSMCKFCKIGFCDIDCMTSYHNRFGCTFQEGENGHNLVTIPPTQKKDYPQKKCLNCLPVRKMRRKMCTQCETGFCNIQCLTSHHQQHVFPTADLLEDQDQAVPGPSGYIQPSEEPTQLSPTSASPATLRDFSLPPQPSESFEEEFRVNQYDPIFGRMSYSPREGNPLYSPGYYSPGYYAKLDELPSKSDSYDSSRTPINPSSVSPSPTYPVRSPSSSPRESHIGSPRYPLDEPRYMTYDVRPPSPNYPAPPTPEDPSSSVRPEPAASCSYAQPPVLRNQKPKQSWACSYAQPKVLIKRKPKQSSPAKKNKDGSYFIPSTDESSDE